MACPGAAKTAALASSVAKSWRAWAATVPDKATFPDLAKASAATETGSAKVCVSAQPAAGRAARSAAAARSRARGRRRLPCGARARRREIVGERWRAAAASESGGAA